MTSPTYLIVLILLAVLLSIVKSKSIRSVSAINSVLIVLVFLILLEGILNVYFRLSGNTWIWNLRQHTNTDLFELHPYLGVRNKKNASKEVGGVTLSHDKYGNRSGTDLKGKEEEVIRIVCLGGSTTYGVGVQNNETWPYYLDSLLGSGYEVVNLAVPGHSSLENLIMSSVYLDDLKPNIVLLHVGLNDLRVSNTDTVLADYSNFHYPHLVGSMGQCYLEKIPHVASFYYLVRAMQSAGTYPVCAFHSAEVRGSVQKDVDERVLEQYRRNLMKLIHMNQFYTEEIIFIPQILIPEMISDGGLSWWIPFISPDKLIGQLDEFNSTTKDAALAKNCHYTEEVLSVDWDSSHFADPSHLNAKGNLILAQVIAQSIENKKDSIDEKLIID